MGINAPVMSSNGSRAVVARDHSRKGRSYNTWEKQKRQPIAYDSCLFFVQNSELNNRDIYCGRAFFPLLDVKRNSLAFIERLKSG